MDLNHIDISSLRNYKRIHKLRTRQNNASKAELVSAAIKHFQAWNTLPPEEEIIETFILNIKSSQ